jgi:hypothetical protein
MRRILALTVVMGGLAACAPVSPSAGVMVGPDGATGAVGASSGRVSGGVTTSGNAYVAADVVQTENMAVSVGTGGVGVAVGNGPVRLGIGMNGWGLRI